MKVVLNLETSDQVQLAIYIAVNQFLCSLTTQPEPPRARNFEGQVVTVATTSQSRHAGSQRQSVMLATPLHEISSNSRSTNPSQNSAGNSSNARLTLNSPLSTALRVSQCARLLGGIQVR